MAAIVTSVQRAIAHMVESYKNQFNTMTRTYEASANNDLFEDMKKPRAWRGFYRSHNWRDFLSLSSAFLASRQTHSKETKAQ